MDTWREKKAELTLVELQVILRFKELVRMVLSLVEPLDLFFEKFVIL
jgi:hypothetical protein